MNELLKMDEKRYNGMGKMPLVQKMFRKCQNRPKNIIYSVMFKLAKRACLIELSSHTRIGGGLYLGHASSITINPECVIGHNVNIHKGVTLGRENRGQRKGCPVIGNNVWIGVNATVVGRISIGDDVLIAPNAYVNKDIPPHSIVYGNPAIIKERALATDGYVENQVEY